MIPHISAPQSSKTTSDFTEMVGDLRKKADTNKDGSVTAAEFGQFLNQLIADTGSKAGTEPTATPERAHTVCRG